MGDIDIHIAGRVGRITLNRPQALNALTYDMVRAVDEALIAWAEDDRLAMVVIDGAGDKAFCAGGDIAEMYASGRAGDYAYGRRFWRDEYAMNARLARFPKPVVSFLHGFTMGGGVGLGCHASHRIVCETSRIAMPECGIGLVPDVGGSLLLARAPGRLGEYLATTAARMTAADAIYAGFSDYFIPADDWPDLIAQLEAAGDPMAIEKAARAPGDSTLATDAAQIDQLFAGERVQDILNALAATQTDLAHKCTEALARVSPLSAAAALMLVRRVRGLDTIGHALELEYRFTHRAMEHGDFLEGIRAAIIDRDRLPQWRFTDHTAAHEAARAMLRPLGDASLKLEGRA